MEPEKHPCETCGRVFTAKITLRQHMITHTEDKPFTCEFCGKSFRSRDSYLGKEVDHQIEYRVEKKSKKCSYSFRVPTICILPIRRPGFNSRLVQQFFSFLEVLYLLAFCYKLI